MSLKPLVKAGVPALIGRKQGNHLSAFAHELVLASAAVLHEGRVLDADAPSTTYNGSTMLTIPIKSLLRGADRQRLQEPLILHLKRNLFFRAALLRLARAGVEQRCAPFVPATLTTEPEFKIDGERFLIDIEVMGQVVRPGMLEQTGEEQG